MSTYLQFLKLTFWMLPLQRWCTVLGIGVLMGLGVLLLPGTGLALNSATLGGVAAFTIPALLGGAFWRALSAPRAVGLAPYGRARLLFAAAGIAATIAVFWVAWQALFDLGLPPQWRTDLAGYQQLFVGVFAAATWWGMASFIASRSPLAMLFVLVTIIGARVIFWSVSGVPTLPQLWKESWGIALPLVLWVAFGIWYLHARRIRPPGWLLPGGQSVFAAVAMAESNNTGLPRRAALERLLLGGTSVPRLLVQWFLVGGLLLGVLLLIARTGEQEASSVAHMAFAALILCPAIVAAQSAAVVRRARALWLPSGFSRDQLFAYTERTLLKFAIGMALVFAAFLLVLWVTQPWRPSLTLIQAVLVMLLPSLQIATHSLTQPGGWNYYLRWPIVLLLCWFIVWKPLTSTDPVSWIGPRGWLWFALAGVATLSFHRMARRRWQVDDLPRAATSR